MEPRLFAILTVLVIGIISFLIGWFITSSKWKRKYFEEVQQRNNFESRNRKLEASLAQAKKNQQESRNRIQLINADIRLLEKEVKQLKKDKESLKNKLYKKQHIIHDTPQRKKVSTILTPITNRPEQETVKSTTTYTKVLNPEKDRLIDPAIKGPVERSKVIIKEVKKEAIPFASTSIYANQLDPIIRRISIFSNADQKDDLQAIKGINSNIAAQLKEAGFFNYKQIAMLTAQDLEDISDFLKLPKNQAMDDAWVAQANKLYHAKYG